MPRLPLFFVFCGLATLPLAACDSSDVPSAPSAAPPPVDQSNQEARLLELSQEITESLILDQDGSLLLAVSDESYVEIAPGGVVESREQLLGDLWAFATVDSISISNERVVLRESTAVVLNRLVIYGPIQGPIGEIGPMTMKTTFGKNNNGDWRVLARAYSVCAPEAVSFNLC